MLDCPGDENEGGERGELGKVSSGFCAAEGEGEGEEDGEDDGPGDGNGEGEGDGPGDGNGGCDDDDVFDDNTETICLRKLYRRFGGSAASTPSSLR